jgi:tetratricopeptide (TPR) repeat protein
MSRNRSAALFLMMMFVPLSDFSRCTAADNLQYLDLAGPFLNFAVVVVANPQSEHTVSGLLLGDQGFVLIPDLPAPQKAYGSQTYAVQLPTGVSQPAHVSGCEAGACLLRVDEPALLQEIYHRIKDAGGIQFNCDGAGNGPVTIVGRFYQEGSPIVVVVPGSIIGSTEYGGEPVLAQPLSSRLKGSVVIGDDGTVSGFVQQGANSEMPYAKIITPRMLRPLMDKAQVECETASEKVRGLVKRGDAAFDQKHYEEARSFFQAALNAATSKTDKWKPLYRLADVELTADKNYGKSYIDAMSAFNASESDFTLLFEAAIAQEKAPNLRGALATLNREVEGLKLAKHKSSDDVHSYYKALFERGRIRLLIQVLDRDRNAGQFAQELNASEVDFNTFVDDKDAKPKHFAYYHIACIEAMRGNLHGAEENLELSKNALTVFANTLGANDAVPPAIEQEYYLYHALNNNNSTADDLVRCPKLLAIVGDKYKLFYNLFPDFASGGGVSNLAK